MVAALPGQVVAGLVSSLGDWQIVSSQRIEGIEGFHPQGPR